jgi:hypothetical protein
MLYHVIVLWIFGLALLRIWIIWHGKRYIQFEYFVVHMINRNNNIFYYQLILSSSDIMFIIYSELDKVKALLD